MAVEHQSLDLYINFICLMWGVMLLNSQMLKIMEYRLEKFIMNPAMLLTILFGVFLLRTEGVVNWNEKWIYFKLSAVVLMLVLHYLLMGYRKGFFLDKNKHSKKFYKIFNEVPMILLIIIVLLVYLKPF